MRLYNTITGQDEEFVPAGDTVKMYVCGITPYAPCHMGHAMSYVIFDVLRRYLEFQGYEVEHVQNFTDIDDKIIQRAQDEGIYPQELAERHIREFMDSMGALNVKSAGVYPRATQEIPHISK
jgi:cysteinyl-tRNA synthetase